MINTIVHSPWIFSRFSRSLPFLSVDFRCFFWPRLSRAQEMQAFVHQHLLSMLSPFSQHLKDLNDDLEAMNPMNPTVESVFFGVFFWDKFKRKGRLRDFFEFFGMTRFFFGVFFVKNSWVWFFGVKLNSCPGFTNFFSTFDMSIWRPWVWISEPFFSQLDNRTHAAGYFMQPVKVMSPVCHLGKPTHPILDS